MPVLQRTQTGSIYQKASMVHKIFFTMSGYVNYQGFVPQRSQLSVLSREVWTAFVLLRLQSPQQKMNCHRKKRCCSERLCTSVHRKGRMHNLSSLVLIVSNTAISVYNITRPLFHHLMHSQGGFLIFFFATCAFAHVNIFSVNNNANMIGTKWTHREPKSPTGSAAPLALSPLPFPNSTKHSAYSDLLPSREHIEGDSAFPFGITYHTDNIFINSCRRP